MKLLADIPAEVQWKYCAHWLLCLAVLPFPFSVALTNVLLGLALAAGIFLGNWWQGARSMWCQHRWFSLVMLSYWGLMLVGLAWSGDRAWGLHVIGRQWFWLLLPILLDCLSDERWRQRFLAALSFALALNLFYCVLQMAGMVHVTTIGSNHDDATGHIGHIGFGVVYGIWAALLLHWGWQRTGLQRHIAWLLALWSWFMIYSAQGRSGYAVALILMLVVVYKQAGGLRRWASVGVLVLGLGVVLALGPGKQRVQDVLLDVPKIQAGEMQQTDVHWSLWKGALDIWRANPAIGAGTGGFPQAAAAVKAQRPELVFGGAPGQIPVHPHNMYLLALARWGVPGGVALVALLGFWAYSGWQRNWGDTPTAPMIALPAIALSIHGLSAPSLEEHFAGIIAMLVTGAGMAGWHKG